MLKTILGTHPLREGDLSQRALTRLRINSIFALSNLPLLAVLDFYVDLETLPLFIKLAVLFISMMFVVPFALSRISSIFIRSRKKLDEWEVLARQEAESFTYRIMGCILLITVLVLVLLDIRGVDDVITLPVDTIGKFIGTFLLSALFLPPAYIAWTRKPLDLG